MARVNMIVLGFIVGLRKVFYRCPALGCCGCGFAACKMLWS